MTAPQVTLCGHAFCFPCVARHAVTNRAEGEPAKCPMCFQPLRLADLRGVRRRPIAPVVARAEDEDANANETASPSKAESLRKPSPVRMSLVSRRRDSAVPVAAATTRAVAAAKAARHRAAAHLAGGDDRAAVTNDERAAAWPRSDFAADGGACDAFAKYTLTSEERALGEEEMSVLEAKVHAMAAEGGADAEQELPYVLLACDAMQTRLAAWAERRAKKRGVEAPPPSVSGPARRDAMAAAARAVARRAAEAKAADAAFPGLPPRAARAASRAAFLGGTAVRAARAFTDDEASEDEASDETEAVETSAGGGGLRDAGEDAEPATTSATISDDAEDSRTDSRTGNLSEPSRGERSSNRANANANANANSRTETYYFYQSEDGQPVVMHSACLKLLLATFGSYDALPASLEAPAVAAERHTQSDETRRRAAHLRHLPLTTEYTVVELELEALVGAEAMRAHGGELRARRRQRREKLDAERREAAVRETAEIRARRAQRASLRPGDEAEHARARPASFGTRLREPRRRPRRVPRRRSFRDRDGDARFARRRRLRKPDAFRSLGARARRRRRGRGGRRRRGGGGARGFRERGGTARRVVRTRRRPGLRVRSGRAGSARRRSGRGRVRARARAGTGGDRRDLGAAGPTRARGMGARRRGRARRRRSSSRGGAREEEGQEEGRCAIADERGGQEVLRGAGA
jgi:hypothetical protein